MCAPTSADASATWRVPTALTVKAASTSVSHRSTAVKAPPWSTSSGRNSAKVCMTASRSSTRMESMSVPRTSWLRPSLGPSGPRSAHRSPPAGTRPANASSRSRPSCPSAPVMRIRTAQPPPVPQAPSATGTRARNGSHHSRCSRVPMHRVRQALLPVDGRRPAQLTLELGGVEHVATVVAGAIRHDRLERRRLSERGQDPVGHFHDRRLHAAAHVVGLAHSTPLEHRVDGGAVVMHVQPFPAVLVCRVERSGWSSSASAQKCGISFSGNW